MTQCSPKNMPSKIINKIIKLYITTNNTKLKSIFSKNFLIQSLGKKYGLVDY